MHESFRQSAERTFLPWPDESVSSVHSPACSHLAFDDRHPARRIGFVHLPSNLGPAGGRLSHHPDSDLLSGCQRGGNDHVGYRSAGAATWPNAELGRNVFLELGWGFSDHFEI